GSERAQVRESECSCRLYILFFEDCTSRLFQFCAANVAQPVKVPAITGIWEAVCVALSPVCFIEAQVYVLQQYVDFQLTQMNCRFNSDPAPGSKSDGPQSPLIRTKPNNDISLSQ